MKDRTVDAVFLSTVVLLVVIGVGLGLCIANAW